MRDNFESNKAPISGTKLVSVESVRTLLAGREVPSVFYDRDPEVVWQFRMLARGLLVYPIVMEYLWVTPNLERGRDLEEYPLPKSMIRKRPIRVISFDLCHPDEQGRTTMAGRTQSNIHGIFLSLFFKPELNKTKID